MSDDWKDADDRLEKWRMRAERSKAYQQAAARDQQWKFMLVGVPTVLLSALTAALGFLGLGFDGIAAFYIGIAIGTIGTISTLLTALQTFLNLGKNSESHQRGSVRFGDVARDIEATLATPVTSRGDLASVVSRYAERMNAAAGEAPPVSRRIMQQVDQLHLGGHGDGSKEE